MPRFAANLSMMFTEVPFLDRFGAAAEAGFTAVEFLFPYAHPMEEVRAKAAAAGVEIVLFNMPPGDWDKGERGLAALPEREAEFTLGLEMALHYASCLGVPRLHMMAGLASASDRAARQRYRDALIEASDLAGTAGVDILIEPLNGRDMPSYFLDSFDLAAEIIGDLDRANVRLQYDIYHRQIMHGDVLRSLAALMPIIGHIQIAAVPERSEPGTGELDDAWIVSQVDRLGYGGYIGFEYRPRTTTIDGLGWVKKMTSGSALAT
ncbi:TIM barrel protein [Devosia sp. PTR5]|uniref:TIM barrel protein n=1 Tax=Devosia oryzisoli TaxID=2774138 RepID=A0A927FWG4_9HYPH|nr:2-oxo-tetronate isomerase [Devosia oryzisoli]MBD8066143.1 TIM barrel protein [Devosia oryzisoli]